MVFDWVRTGLKVNIIGHLVVVFFTKKGRPDGGVVVHPGTKRIEIGAMSWRRERQIQSKLGKETSTEHHVSKPR